MLNISEKSQKLFSTDKMKLAPFVKTFVAITLIYSTFFAYVTMLSHLAKKKRSTSALI